MLYLLRNYVELSYLSLKNGCKIDEFVFRFELSKYELKNDVMILKEMAPSYGFSIEEQDGYLALLVEDEALYDKMYKLFYSCYYTNRFIFNDNDILIQLMISSTLLNKGCLNLEEFAEHIGFSKSNLRIPVKKTRAFLKKYQLNTFGKPYYGLCCEGSEYDLRICLSDLYVKLNPEIMYVGEHDYIEQFDYLPINQAFGTFCEEQHLRFSSEDNKAICYYLAVVQNRLAKGHVIEELNIEHAMLEELSKNTRLQQMALAILAYLDLNQSYYEVLALMVVLLNCNVSTQDTMYYVNTVYADEYIALEQCIFAKLKEFYHLRIEEEVYLKAIHEEISTIMIKKHTGKIEKITERFLGRTPNVHAFPLCYFINETLTDTISAFYHLEINRAVTETLADIVYYYIENLDFSFHAYDIVVASRFDRYAPLLLKEKLKKELDPKYIGKVDTCDHFATILYHTQEYVDQYDLIITDAKLYNVKNGISFADVNNSIVKLETYLRLHRDMCSCLSLNDDITVFHQNIKITKLESLAKILAADGHFTLQEVIEGVQHSYTLKGILSILVPSNHDSCRIQFGDFSNPILIENQKIYSYHIVKVKLSEHNIRITNLILHELILDPIFVATLKENPCKDTLNEQVNMIIK